MPARHSDAFTHAEPLPLPAGFGAATLLTLFAAPAGTDEEGSTPALAPSAGPELSGAGVALTMVRTALALGAATLGAELGTEASLVSPAAGCTREHASAIPVSNVANARASVPGTPRSMTATR
ncbi:MAG TPA: hypothetical protein VGJ91_24645 [Polyangiaceae bacterium]|jgi:hypothetical protein